MFYERCKLAMKRFNLPASAVLGHNEFKGASTNCPGIDMNMIRKRLVSSTDVVKPTGSTSPSLQAETDFTLNSKARREIIVNAAVKEGSNKLWQEKLADGTISDEDLKQLALKYVVDVNK